MAALRVAAIALAAGIAAARPDGAQSALFFFFEPTTATPGDRVTVRTGGTPRGFQPNQRAGSLRREMRLYLVRNAVADKVRARHDSRLHFIGSLRPDYRGRGVLTFPVPPLDSGSYAAAVWCPECARSSFGRTFFVLGVHPRTVNRFRRLMLLRVVAPRATADRCPVTQPSNDRPRGLEGDRWYGNGKLWAWLPPGGVLRVAPGQVNPDGSMFDKPGWLPTGIGGVLAVHGRRIDGPAPPLRVHAVSWGHNTATGRGGWRSAITYPMEGCWKLTGRVEDVSLSYVLKVERL